MYFFLKLLFIYPNRIFMLLLLNIYCLNNTNHCCNGRRKFSSHSLSVTIFNSDRLFKSLTVAEMGDRLATIDMDRKEGAASAFLEGEGRYMSPPNTTSPEARSVAQAPAGAQQAWCSSSLAC